MPDPYYGGPDGFTEVLDDDPRGGAGAAGVRQGPAVTRPAELDVRRSIPLGGGAARVELADGRTVVVKEGPGVAAEAAGLRWLAVPGGPPVPRCSRSRASGSSRSTSRRGRPSAAAATELGRRLAVLHAAGAPAFGCGPPEAPARRLDRPGADAQRPGRDWAPWYAEHRLAPVPAHGSRRRRPDRRRGRRGRAVCARLPELAGPPEPPARLHGDLWSGNVLWSPTAAWLIDPAAHGGHRETDLAMLALFGCPHLTRCWAPTTRPRRWPPAGATASRSTSCSRCSCTWCCSAAATPARPSPQPARLWAPASPRVARLPPRAHRAAASRTLASDRHARDGPCGQACAPARASPPPRRPAGSCTATSAVRADRRRGTPAPAACRRRRARRSAARPCPAGRGSSGRAGSRGST